MINYKIGDVLAQKFTKKTMICHIVNSENKFGAGFALAVARKYRHVKMAYNQWFHSTFDMCELRDEDIPFMLGKIQIVKAKENLYIVNMLAEAKPGGELFDIGEKRVFLRPIRLDSLRECLYNVAVVAAQENMNVVGPMFGSGLARGKWDEEIVPLIQECWCDFGINPVIYKLN